MSKFDMKPAFNADECPLQLWLNKYKQSLDKYNEHKRSYLNACNELKDLTGWSMREIESNKEWGRCYV